MFKKVFKFLSLLFGKKDTDTSKNRKELEFEETENNGMENDSIDYFLAERENNKDNWS